MATKRAIISDAFLLHPAIFNSWIKVMAPIIKEIKVLITVHIIMAGTTANICEKDFRELNIKLGQIDQTNLEHCKNSCWKKQSD